MGKRTIFIAIVAVAAMGLGVLAWHVTSRQEVPNIDGLLWPQSKALKPFALVDQRQQPFTLDRLKGHWSLLFFGYTNCPDVCPVTLSVLKTAKTLMSDAGTEPPQVVFISVDPARDTPARLGAYVAQFDADFLGVTGKDADLGELARQLGVLYVRGEPDEDGSYTVDHTAAVFLIDPRAHLVALFQAPQSAKRIARDLPRIERLKWN